MSKRSRVSRSDSFDQPNKPNNNSSTDNANKLFKPSCGPFKNSSASSSSVGMTIGQTSGLGDFFKECSFCRSKFKQDHNIFMYRSLAFCTEECRAIRIAYDEELMKKQSNKKEEN